jgi:hypothetical protein
VDSEITTAYVGLGSNLGDRSGNLLYAVRGLLEASFSVNKLSAIYETEPIELEDSENFLNMVAEIKVTNVTSSQMMVSFPDRIPARTATSHRKNLEPSTSIYFFLAANTSILPS